MKHTTSLHTIDHEGARRMEAFIRHIEEPLTEVPFDWKRLPGAEHVHGAIRLLSQAEDPVTIIVFFCNSYSDAEVIANANGFTQLPNARWSQNGSILYFVESLDEEKVSNILGLFAGRE